MAQDVKKPTRLLFASIMLVEPQDYAVGVLYCAMLARLGVNRTCWLIEHSELAQRWLAAHSETKSR